MKEPISPRFDDPRNITIGQARVIWAPAWYSLPEGWTIPGGRRTQDHYVAHEYAMRMDKMMQEPIHVR